MEYEELIDILIDYCETGELIPEQRFINTFDIMCEQDLIYVEAPFSKKYLLNQHRIMNVKVGDLSMYVSVMTVELYDKKHFRSNSILIRKIDNESVIVLGITDRAKGNNVIYGNLEKLFEWR